MTILRFGHVDRKTIYTKEQTEREEREKKREREREKGRAVGPRKYRNGQLSLPGSRGLFYFLANGPVSGHVVKLRKLLRNATFNRKNRFGKVLLPFHFRECTALESHAFSRVKFFSPRQERQLRNCDWTVTNSEMFLTNGKQRNCWTTRHREASNEKIIVSRLVSPVSFFFFFFFSLFFVFSFIETYSWLSTRRNNVTAQRVALYGIIIERREPSAGGESPRSTR